MCTTKDYYKRHAKALIYHLFPIYNVFLKTDDTQHFRKDLGRPTLSL